MVPESPVPCVIDVVQGTGVRIASALDFPTCGVMTSMGKAAEAQSLRTWRPGNLLRCAGGMVESRALQRFLRRHGGGGASGSSRKVMLELPLLTEEEKEMAVKLSLERASIPEARQQRSG